MILTNILCCNASLLEYGFLKSHMPSDIFVQRRQSSHILLSFVGAADWDDVLASHFWNIRNSEIILMLIAFVDIQYFCFVKALLKLLIQHLHSISSCPRYVWVCAQSNVTLLACSCWNVALCQQTWYCSMQQYNSCREDPQIEKKFKELFFSLCVTWRKFHFDCGADVTQI